jgi:hypothetical protein
MRPKYIKLYIYCTHCKLEGAELKRTTLQPKTVRKRLQNNNFEADFPKLNFLIYCRSNWSVPQILIQYTTSGWPIHFIKFLEIFINFLWKSQFQEFDHSSGHFLSIYDWLVAQTTKVIGAFNLFNRKFTVILGNVLNQYLRNTSIGTIVI